MVQPELCQGLQNALGTESPPLHGSFRVHEYMELFHSNFQRKSSKWDKQEKPNLSIPGMS